MAHDSGSVIEAAYRYEEPGRWLRSIAQAAAQSLGYEEGVLAVQYQASRTDWLALERIELVGVTPDFARLILGRPTNTSTESVDLVRRARMETLLEEPLTRHVYRLDFRDHGISEVFVIEAGDPTGRGCMFCFPQRAPRPERVRSHTWKCVSAHIAAGYRLQRELAGATSAPEQTPEHAEAVLTSDGKVVHARRPAGPRSARQELCDALVRIHRASSRREPPEHAVEMWKALVTGRWSIVESFERDGQQYYLAHRNDPRLARQFALSEREQQVLALAELGHSNKLIGYTLRLSTSAVSTLLSRARRKLRQSSLTPLRPRREEA